MCFVGATDSRPHTACNDDGRTRRCIGLDAVRGIQPPNSFHTNNLVIKYDTQMIDRPWPFADPPSVLAFTTRAIVEKHAWIHRVTHDAEDGAWQFHSVHGAPTEMSEARLVSLRTMMTLDPSIAELADLQLGWSASRDGPTADWHRVRMEE